MGLQSRSLGLQSHLKAYTCPIQQQLWSKICNSLNLYPESLHPWVLLESPVSGYQVVGIVKDSLSCERGWNANCVLNKKMITVPLASRSCAFAFQNNPLLGADGGGYTNSIPIKM